LFGTSNAPAGLLGSDVLSRFGSVRLDFRSQMLRVDGREGPAVVNSEITGMAVPSSVDARLAQGDGYTTVPLSVVAQAGGVEAMIDQKPRDRSSH